MPQNYKRKTGRGVKDVNALLQAIKKVKIDGAKPIPVAREYNIPKSSFVTYLAKFNRRVTDISDLTDDQLLNEIKNISSYGAPTVCFIV